MSAASLALAYSAMPRAIRAQAVTPPITLTSAQMREDFAFLQTQWAPRDRSFSDPQRALFKRVVDEAAAGVGTASMSDFALDVMRAVAIPRNGHTAASVGRLLGSLPIRMWWFADGLYVLSADHSHAHLIGARLESLGKLSPLQALANVAPYISGTDQRIRYLSASYLACPAVLQRIGAAATNSASPMTFTLRDGTPHAEDLGEAAMPDPGDPHSPVFNGWSVLVPDDMAMPDRWQHVLDSVETRSPAYAKPADFSMKWLGDGPQTLYIRSTRTQSQGSDRLDEKLLFGALQGQVLPRQPHAVIIDLRLNNGGNFFNTLLFAQALPKLIPADARIFLLISRATFSAAIVTVAMIKGAGGKRVTLIGEAMGDNGRFWAEPEMMTLPNSKIQVFCSTKLEDYEHGCDDLSTCYWATVAFGPKDISLQPDIGIDVAFGEYATGKDPVLEKAQSLAAGR